MSTFWKAMIGLVLLLPMAAYITGTLVSSPADLSPERAPVVIPDSPSVQPTPDTKASPKATNRPDDTNSANPTTRPKKKQDDRGGRGDNGGVQVVRPTPNVVGDDDGGDDDDGGNDSDDGEGDGDD